MRTKSYGQLEREIESLETQVQFLQDELEAAMRLKDLAVAAEREAIIAILARREFTSLHHMPSEAALIIRMRGGA